MDGWRNGLPHPSADPAPVEHQNPFQLLPALQFGALFTLIVFVSKAAAAQAGQQAFVGTSVLGGLVDVATVVAPASDLVHSNGISVRTAEIAVLLALGSNAALKIVLAAISGTRAFVLRLGAAFMVWGAAAVLGFLIG